MDYVYVQAISLHSEADHSCGQFGCGRLISFRYTRLSATDDDDAYQQGHAWSDAHPLLDCSLHNDFVIPVSQSHTR